MDYQKIEKKWQKKWKEAKIFEPERTGKKYYLTIPFPYTSGAQHIGHGRTFATGDFIARFKRKQGYNVLWPMGFHRSGTPILAISDKIKKGDKETIDLFTSYVALKETKPEKIKDIVKSFENPEKVANYFADMLEDGFNEIGLSIDWRRKFKTGEEQYNKFVEWQFEKLNKGDALTQGSYPITYCVQCNNAVGEDDIKDGDTDEVSINEFTSIKFKLGDKNLVASTLRPETIYGITNLWVNPEATYVEAEVNNEIIIISSDAYNKITLQHKNTRKLRELNGMELIGKTVLTPIGSEVLVLPGSFVDSDMATGVVYSVPAHAPFDYVALRDLQTNDELIKKYGLNTSIIKNIKPVIIIDIIGYKKEPAIEAVEKRGIKNQSEAVLIEEATKEVYKDEFYKGTLNGKCAEFSGLKITDVKDKVKNKLIKQEKAFTFYETSRKATCRCKGKVIIAVLNDQWFLDYTSKDWKDKTRKLVNKMTIISEKYRKSFIDTIDWVTKRPCARKRGIGTKLPYDNKWVIESLSDSTIYMAYYTIANVINKNKIKAEELTTELFDYVFLGKGETTNKYAKEMREEFTYWYPLDHRHTAPAHISNHLTFFLMHHTKIFPEKYWPKTMSFNEMVIKDGAKMSKSKGNIIPLAHVSRDYSADLYRLFILSSIELDSVVDWKENEVSSVKNKLIGFANLALNASKSSAATKLNNIDKWIISRFYTRLKEAYKQGNELKIRSYCVNLFFEFINEVNYYKKRVSAEQFNSVIRKILPDWVTALEPIIPHLCEEIWSQMNEGFVSLQKFSKIKETLINKEIEQNEEVVVNTISDLNELVKIIKNKPKKISLFVADEWKYKLYEIIIKAKNKHDFKELIGSAMKNEEVKKNGKEATRIIENLVRNPSRVPLRTPNREGDYKALNESLKYFEEEFNCEVDVVKSNNPKALPGKPGILIE